MTAGSASDKMSLVQIKAAFSAFLGFLYDDLKSIMNSAHFS